MKVIRAPAMVLVALMAGAMSARAQDDLAKKREALALISQTADRICFTATDRGSQSNVILSGDAKAELNGILSKLANLGIGGTAKYASQEYQNVLQEQLPSVIAQSQDCKRGVFEKLVTVLLVAPPPSASFPVSPERIEADVVFNCRRLQAWPYESTSLGESVVGRLRQLEPQSSYARSATLAMLYRCLGAGTLISNGELPDKLRTALPYLDRSLTLDPQQNLLRQNITFLVHFLQAGGGDIKAFTTNLLQVIRGSNDPDIPQLVDELAKAAQSSSTGR